MEQDKEVGVLEDGHTIRAFLVVSVVAFFCAALYYLLSDSLPVMLLIYFSFIMMFFKLQTTEYLRYIIVMSVSLSLFAVGAAKFVPELMLESLGIYAFLAIAVSPRK